MSDHQSDIEFAIGVALKCGTIRTHEERDMRAMISRYGLETFESLLKARERGAATDEERIYQRFGLTQEWVNERLK